MISLYFSSVSSFEFFGSSKPSDFPFLGLLFDLLLHIGLVTLLRRSQSFVEAPRPSNAAPTHLRSQLFVKGWLMALILSISIKSSLPLIWLSWSTGLWRMSLHHNAWWSCNHREHHGYCTHDISEGKEFVISYDFIIYLHHILDWKTSVYFASE